MQIVTRQGHANKCPILDDESPEEIEIGTYYQISSRLLVGNLFNLFVPVGDFHLAIIDRITNLFKGICILQADLCI